MGTERTSHALVDAALALQHDLHLKIHNMLTSPGRASGPSVEWALVRVVNRHRPRAEDQELEQMRSRPRRPYRGWSPVLACGECAAPFQQCPYPCGTIRDICEELRVEIPEVLG